MPRTIRYWELNTDMSSFDKLRITLSLPNGSTPLSRTSPKAMPVARGNHQVSLGEGCYCSLIIASVGQTLMAEEILLSLSHGTFLTSALNSSSFISNVFEASTAQLPQPIQRFLSIFSFVILIKQIIDSQPVYT